MLTLFGPKRRYCDGLARRSFLKIGGLALGGLTLPELLRAETAAGDGTGLSHKAVIMVYLSGGLAHQDTFDMKPDAPDEIRGEFRPIATKIPGVQIGESPPRMAAVLDRVAVIRLLVGQRDEHSSFQSLTGFSMGQSQREGKPHFGSVVAKVQGPAHPVVPPFVDLFPTMQHNPYYTPGPGWLGLAHRPARIDGDDLVLLKQQAVTSERFAGRQRLLGQFDQFRRTVDSAEIGGMDTVYQRAFEVLTTSRVARALDLEPAKIQGSENAVDSARPSTSAMVPHSGTTSC